jgi:hypothetical protein
MLRTSTGSAPNTARALDQWLDLTAKDAAAGAPTPPSSKAARESADVVKATVKLGEPGPDGKRLFTVTLAIAAPYHVYSNQVGNDTLADSKTTMAVFVGNREIDVVRTFPLGTEVKDAVTGSYRIYIDGNGFGGVLPAGVNPAEVEFRVRVIACREGRCLLPSTLRVRP